MSRPQQNQSLEPRRQACDSENEWPRQKLFPVPAELEIRQTIFARVGLFFDKRINKTRK